MTYPLIRQSKFQLTCSDCDVTAGLSSCRTCYYEHIDPADDPFYLSTVQYLSYFCGSLLVLVSRSLSDLTSFYLTDSLALYLPVLRRRYLVLPSNSCLSNLAERSSRYSRTRTRSSCRSSPTYARAPSIDLSTGRP